MIKSLYQINSALIGLSQQLSNKQSSNETIKRCIHDLVEEVRFLDDKEKYHYYLLISEIYATRFQNIEEAQQELQQFGKTLNSEISMNCELRIAFFKFFQQSYKDAFKHLDLALGEVEEELKLIDNAKFFFNRILNKDYLTTQSRDKNNFQAGFILSLIFEHQNEHIQALKQIQSFLDHSPNDNFRKFQIYKRLLQLYQSMKKNSISTISISKKSLQTYREDLTNLEARNTNFQENYLFKCKFVQRVIDFIQTDSKQQSEKLMKKMLDFKLLAYYKLKKCSKQAPNKDIKMTLQNTAKIIKLSKETELLESILNYDFIKKEYEVFKVFYKANIVKKLANLKFFSALCNLQPGKIRKMANNAQKNEEEANYPMRDAMKEKSLFSKKPRQISFEQRDPYNMPLSNVNSSKNVPKNEKPQSQLYSFNQNNPNVPNSYNYNYNPTNTIQKPSPFPPQQSTFSKQPSTLPFKETQSELVISQFQGSKMYKFNATSQGHQQRYFYVIPQKLNEKPRLYYCMSKNNKSSNDSYYSLKGLKKIVVGKQTQALRRKQAAKYSDSQCFSLIFNDGKDRSFYVPNQDDLQRWVIFLQTKVLYTDSNIDKMTHTMGYQNKESKINSMNRSSPPTKKSRKIVDI